MHYRTIILFILICCTSCQNDNKENTGAAEAKTTIEFDSEKWKVKDGREYPYRDSMLTDLMTDEAIRELSKDSILQLLGEPYKIDNNHLFYRIREKRMIINWTLHTKTLVIKLNEEDAIEWMKIHE